MQGAVRALYEPLLERDSAALPAAVRTFLAERSVDDLWLAVTRFAVLAFAPSMHSRRALISCHSADALRFESDEQKIAMLIECARYAAAGRPPWSEPPLLDPPPSGPEGPALADLAGSGDRQGGEQWLAAHLESAEAELLPYVSGESRLLFDAVRAVAPRLGEAGRFALFRTVLWDLVAASEPEPSLTMSAALDAVVRERGSVESVTAFFVAEARERPRRPDRALPSMAPLPYTLARDFAQTLIAHEVASRLGPAEREVLLAAVRENLEQGESFEEWSHA